MSALTPSQFVAGATSSDNHFDLDALIVRRADAPDPSKAVGVASVTVTRTTAGSAGVATLISTVPARSQPQMAAGANASYSSLRASGQVWRR